MLWSMLVTLLIACQAIDNTIDVYVDCTATVDAENDCSEGAPCSSISSSLEQIARNSASGEQIERAVVHILPGVCSGPSNTDVMYYPLSVTGVSSNITVAVIGSWQNETVVDCGCNFETNCNSGNATRAFIMGLKGIVSVSDLTVRNCGGSPQVDEAKLLKTPLHELPFPRDVWDGIASDNSATRRSRLGGGILIEVRRFGRVKE
jgi:hypothetical protein